MAESGARLAHCRRISDARLAVALRHHGIAEFATSNVKDFEGFGFDRVYDPLAEK